jgi:hypothetical protein
MPRRCRSSPKALFLVRRQNRPKPHYKSCQTPLDEDGSLADRIRRKNWKAHSLFCPDCALKKKKKKRSRQRHQYTEKAALKSRVEELGAEPLAAAAARVRFKHAGEATSAGGVPAAAASISVQYTHTRAAARSSLAARMRARRCAVNPEWEAARVALAAARQ